MTKRPNLVCWMVGTIQQYNPQRDFNPNELRFNTNLLNTLNYDNYTFIIKVNSEEQRQEYIKALAENHFNKQNYKFIFSPYAQEDVDVFLYLKNNIGDFDYLDYSKFRLTSVAGLIGKEKCIHISQLMD